MKNIKRFNESIDIDKKYFLIESDGGDCLYFTGVYNNVSDFIEDIKPDMIKKFKCNESQLVVNSDDEQIKIMYMNSYELFHIYEIDLNRNYYGV